MSRWNRWVSTGVCVLVRVHPRSLRSVLVVLVLEHLIYLQRSTCGGSKILIVLRRNRPLFVDYLDGLRFTEVRCRYAQMITRVSSNS